MGTQIPSGPLHYSFQRSVIYELFCPTLGRSWRNQKLGNPNAQSFTHTELQNAMLETIASINQFSEEAGVNEVCRPRLAKVRSRITQSLHKPSLMNFCVTDGASVVATRYVSSRNDAAASLVCTLFNHPFSPWSRKSHIISGL
jgi:hypothetical protein